MSLFRVLATGIAVVSLSACSAEKKNVDTARDTTAAPTAAPTTTPAPAPAPTPPVDNSVPNWKVTEVGIGPLRAGMTTREAVAVLQGAGVSATADSSKSCHYLKWTGPTGIGVMLDQGVVARFDIDNPAVTTKEGAKIGDSEAQVQSLYAGRIAVQPHKYTAGGHYLVVTPVAPSDSAHRVVFETDGKKVTKFRSGKQPQVSYVERCG